MRKAKMSRVGRQPINIPEGVSFTQEGDVLAVKGPKGELKIPTFPQLNVKIEEHHVAVEAKEKNASALHGLLRSLIANAVRGVSEGFEKRLELVGTGYRVKKEGEKLTLTLGFSHPVVIEPSQDIALDIEGQKEIIVKGIDKQRVGQMAANIRKLKKPEPYKGKGIRYKGEEVRRKPGKAAKVGATQGES